MAESYGNALRDICLAALAGPELHGRGDVERQPRDERTFGEVDTDVRLVSTGSYVPVDATHVVAGHVRTDHGQLGTRSEQVRSIVARKHPLHFPADRDVERS